MQSGRPPVAPRAGAPVSPPGAEEGAPFGPGRLHRARTEPLRRAVSHNQPPIEYGDAGAYPTTEEHGRTFVTIKVRPYFL